MTFAQATVAKCVPLVPDSVPAAGPLSIIMLFLGIRSSWDVIASRSIVPRPQLFLVAVTHVDAVVTAKDDISSGIGPPP